MEPGGRPYTQSGLYRLPDTSRCNASTLLLRGDDRHDFEAIRIDDQDVVADDDIIVAFILRHDLNDIFRKNFPMHIARHNGADGHVEVHIRRQPSRTVVTDDGLDFTALGLR